MAEITLAAIPRLDFVTRGSVAWGAEAAGTISFSMEGHGGVDSYCIVKLGHAQVQPCPILYRLCYSSTMERRGSFRRGDTS